jgi:ABC-type ATPase with predicted acetyltransferase domain
VGQSVTCYGARVGVRVSDPRALPALLDRLPPGWKPKPAKTVERLYSLVVGGNGDGRVRRLNLLYGNAELLARTRDFEEALDRFAADVQLHVAEHARRQVFVHAGVVGWRGRAIVMPGKSFSGKTTLVRELVRAGATYYSDDYAVFDERGRVHPFPRQLAIRRNGEYVQERHPVESLGGVAGEIPLPVGLVAVTEYDARVQRWRPRRLSVGQGVLELLAHAVAARRRTEAVLQALDRATADAQVLKGRRGEAERIATRVLELAS